MKLTIISLLFISITSFGQSFQFVQPAGTSGFNVNNTTHIREGLNGEIHCLTRGDSIIMTLENNQWSLIGRNTNGFSPVGSAPTDFEILSNGDIWVVNFNSIDVWDGSTVTTMTTSNSNMVNDYVVGVVPRNNNDIWIGYSNGFGLSKVTGSTWTNKGDFTGNFSPLNNIFTPKLMERNRLTDEVWIIYSSTIYKISSSNVTQYAISSAGVSSLSSSNFKDMTVTDDGKVWFALESNANDPDQGGLLSFDGSSWTHYNTNNSTIPNNSLSALTHYGNRVVFTSNAEDGVTILDNGVFTTYNSSNSNFPAFQPYGYVRDLLKQDNKIYMGTDAGIMIMEMPFPSEVSELNNSKLTDYPNPTSNFVTVTDARNIQIIDLLGNVLISSKTGINIDISSLASGVYIIKGVDDQNNILKNSFIKK